MKLNFNSYLLLLNFYSNFFYLILARKDFKITFSWKVSCLCYIYFFFIFDFNLSFWPDVANIFTYIYLQLSGTSAVVRNLVREFMTIPYAKTTVCKPIHLSKRDLRDLISVLLLLLRFTTTKTGSNYDRLAMLIGQ